MEENEEVHTAIIRIAMQINLQHVAIFTTAIQICKRLAVVQSAHSVNHCTVSCQGWRLDFDCMPL